VELSRAVSSEAGTAEVPRSRFRDRPADEPEAGRDMMLSQTAAFLRMAFTNLGYHSPGRCREPYRGGTYPSVLVSGRTGIVPVTVLVPNHAVATVDDEFDPVGLGLGSRLVFRSPLPPETPGPVYAMPSDAPQPPAPRRRGPVPPGSQSPEYLRENKP